MGGCLAGELAPELGVPVRGALVVELARGVLAVEPTQGLVVVVSPHRAPRFADVVLDSWGAHRHDLYHPGLERRRSPP